MKSSLRILIIEDDKYCRLNLREILGSYGLIDEATDVATAISLLDNNHYDLALTDIELGDRSGVELIPLLVGRGIHTLVVSSFEGDEIVERAYTLGAKHFLSKLRLKEQLPIYVRKLLQEKTSRFEKFVGQEFITRDTALIEELRGLCEINWKNQTLFISGPTGTGKSLLGKLIHELTHPEANLVHLNCSEVPENLLESELFGHEKGAFTGADQKKEGKLKLAHGGTLFLDEVGTMPISMQQKLLKAIDEKTFYPVGSSTPVRAEFTLITATCEDIADKMAKKEFREDFFFRISGFQFHLRPLCERQEDIELLVKHFQRRANRRFVIRPEAMELLKKHPWPGNVRELIKVCERFSQTITGIIDGATALRTIGPSRVQATLQEDWNDFILQHGLRSFITRLEQRAVDESMKRNNGKITACIKELKISSSAFYRILQESQSLN